MADGLMPRRCCSTSCRTPRFTKTFVRALPRRRRALLDGSLPHFAVLDTG